MTALFEPGSIFIGGWVPAHGGDTAIVEPATGRELGRTGVADASDVDKACARAANAQKEWAAATFSDRAAVLRKAGAALEANFAEIQDWVVRETGAVPDMAAFAVGVAAQECYEAAALASMPPGELLPTAEPRLSMLRRVPAGARLASGGTHDGLFYRPTVLDQVGTDMPAYANEVFGPVAPVVRFASEDEAVALAADSEYGLSLSILTGDAMRGLALAERIPTGIAHINDQTVNDEAVAPFGGVASSGTGARFGGLANLDAFTESRWITVRGQIPVYPF